MEYTPQNTFVLAKRFNNTKRSYLLVNPLQAKHIPVSPTVSLEMMTALGKKLAEKYPETRLIIGFAETATAIGAAVSEQFPHCTYMHTTREEIPSSKNWVYFSEEHSHATEQKLCADNLARLIKNTPSIILIDDELSTGKTLINIVNILQKTFPDTADKQIIAASIINRISPENHRRLADFGIKTEYLVKLPDEDLSAAVEKFDISEAEKAPEAPADFEKIITSRKLINTRLGTDITEYSENCKRVSEEILDILEISPNSSVLVLGTEECMYPALVFGRELEQRNPGVTVKCHATTRSPIGIGTDPDYPIRSGNKLSSFYDSSRKTYIYNLEKYDYAVIITDSPNVSPTACNNLCGLLSNRGCKKIYVIEGG